MPSQVFWGSPRQARLDAKETLPARLDLILERLRIRDRVKGETVAIKMHTSAPIGLGTRETEQVDGLPVEQITRAPVGYIPAR